MLFNLYKIYCSYNIMLKLYRIYICYSFISYFYVNKPVLHISYKIDDID